MEEFIFSKKKYLISYLKIKKFHENDILPILIKKKKIKGIYSNDFFIDIGV